MNRQQVFDIKTEQDFNKAALEIFHYQAQHTGIYRDYIRFLNVNIESITDYRQIPFLPIQFFKTHHVVAGVQSPEITFSSSGTTGTISSRHPVTDVRWYIDSFRKAFHLFYGDIRDVAVLALLPSYLEREGSSLIYMVDDFLKNSQRKESGYFLYNHHELYETLKHLNQSGAKTMLIGVTYALLDFIADHKISFPGLIVMETGGMKGKRKEMVRQELHEELKKGFGVDYIHSEYGMTELLSQGYSKGNGIFSTPPWMKILIRDTNDPLSLLKEKKTGAINVIDLANYHSCSFIATQDLGKVHPDQSFEILGRFDNSDIRGCNLLVQ